MKPISFEAVARRMLRLKIKENAAEKLRVIAKARAKQIDSFVDLSPSKESGRIEQNMSITVTRRSIVRTGLPSRTFRRQIDTRRKIKMAMQNKTPSKDNDKNANTQDSLLILISQSPGIKPTELRLAKFLHCFWQLLGSDLQPGSGRVAQFNSIVQLGQIIAKNVVGKNLTG
jgi:hypothetical protein